MTVPEPRENPGLLGHEAAEATLLAAMRGGRMHHAWLLAGPSGIGKATLGFRFARRLLAGPPDAGVDSLALTSSDPVFRRVAACTHADLMTVERDWDERTRRQRAEIAVDAVRAVVEFMRMTPAEAGWRVVVVDGDQYLGRNAANALLKITEEPPARAVLLLASSAPGRLLPTLRSRCRRLRLDALATPLVSELMAGFMPELPTAERERLAALAEGSPGRALALAEEEGVALASLAADVLGAVPNLPAARSYEVADRLGRSDGAFTTFMDLLRRDLAAAVRGAARGEGPGGGAGWLAARPLADWAEVWHALTGLQAETERFHLDRRQAVVSGLALLNGP